MITSNANFHVPQRWLVTCLFLFLFLVLFLFVQDKSCFFLEALFTAAASKTPPTTV